MAIIQNRATSLVVDLDDAAREVAAALSADFAEPVRAVRVPGVWADDRHLEGPEVEQSELFATESLRRRANLR